MDLFPSLLLTPLRGVFHDCSTTTLGDDHARGSEPRASVDRAPSRIFATDARRHILCEQLVCCHEGTIKRIKANGVDQSFKFSIVVMSYNLQKLKRGLDPLNSFHAAQH